MTLKLWEIALLSLYGTIMFVSKLIMESLPNIHLIAMFIVTFTVIYRAKALIPIYIYVFLCGIYMGFQPWWVANLYIWTILWAAVMLLPKKMPQKIAVPVYMGVAAAHGFCYGILCAPCQALFFGLNFEGTITWIISGFWFDMLHGFGNLIAGALIYPLLTVLRKLTPKK